MKELIHHTGRFSIIYSDYFEITGDACAAQLLSSLEYWTKCKLSVIEEIEKQNAEAVRNNAPLLPVPELWLYEKIQDFVDSLCGTFKRNKVLEGLKILKEKGFVESKPSPNPWDKTCFWRMNVEKVRDALRFNQNNSSETEKPKTPRVQIQTLDSLDSNQESLNSDLESLNSNLVESLNLNSHPYMIHDLTIIQDQNSINSPLTPQGETVGEIFQSDSVFQKQKSEPEGTVNSPSRPTAIKQAPCTAQNINPEIKHPPAIENDYHFVPSDPTAENMATWNAIAATGAMKGATSVDPSFLEYYRLFLSKCSAYKGKECNSNHAKASLKKQWREEPLRILAEAENWQKSQAIAVKQPSTRNIDEIPKDELYAILKAVEDKNQQKRS